MQNARNEALGSAKSLATASGPGADFLTPCDANSGCLTALAPGNASTVALEALYFQIEIVADELVPLPAGLSAVTDQDRLPELVG